MCETLRSLLPCAEGGLLQLEGAHAQAGGRARLHQHDVHARQGAQRPAVPGELSRDGAEANNKGVLQVRLRAVAMDESGISVHQQGATKETIPRRACSGGASC